MRLNPAQAPADGQVSARCRITLRPGLCSTHIPTPRAQVVSTRPNRQPKPGASAGTPPGRWQAGQQVRHCGPRRPPAKDDRSQLANCKGGCS